MRDVKVIIGGSLEDDAAAFVDAWHRTERGEDVRERTLIFESWETLAKVLTGERLRLLNMCMRIPNRQSRPSRILCIVNTGVCMPMSPRWKQRGCLRALKELCMLQLIP